MSYRDLAVTAAFRYVVDLDSTLKAVLAHLTPSPQRQQILGPEIDFKNGSENNQKQHKFLVPVLAKKVADGFAWQHAAPTWPQDGPKIA